MADETFDTLMQRLQDGDDDAAAEVYGRYLRRLVGLASKQFDPWLRHKVDLEGVVQSAYKSFFVRHRQGQFTVDDWESLWGLLALITLRKCHRRHEYLAASCRDPGREVSGTPANADARGRWEPAGKEPTPEEAAMLAETVAGLLEGLEPSVRDIVELSLEGYSTPEIADSLGRSRRTVQRVRERIKTRLNAFLDEGVGALGQDGG